MDILVNTSVIANAHKNPTVLVHDEIITWILVGAALAIWSTPSRASWIDWWHVFPILKQRPPLYPIVMCHSFIVILMSISIYLGIHLPPQHQTLLFLNPILLALMTFSMVIYCVYYWLLFVQRKIIASTVLIIIIWTTSFASVVCAAIYQKILLIGPIPLFVSITLSCCLNVYVLIVRCNRRRRRVMLVNTEEEEMELNDLKKEEK